MATPGYPLHIPCVLNASPYKEVHVAWEQKLQGEKVQSFLRIDSFSQHTTTYINSTQKLRGISVL